MKTIFFFYSILFSIVMLTSCDMTENKQEQLADEKQQFFVSEENHLAEDGNNSKSPTLSEKELEEKAIYEKYINNSLNTGSTPYSYLYGSYNECSGWECSQIKVKTPNNSDVLVTIKQNGKVIRHAYIKASSSYIFDLPDGTYQTFFYYGKGWNPEKIMKQTPDGTLKGGFVSNEEFGKDSPQKLSNNVLEYELILQTSGNFSTKPSNSNEAF